MSPKTRSHRKTSERQTKFRCFLALNLSDTSHFWGNIITYRLLGRYKGYEPSADRSATKQKQLAKQLSIRYVTLQDGNLDLYIRFENDRKSLTWINVSNLNITGAEHYSLWMRVDVHSFASDETDQSYSC